MAKKFFRIIFTFLGCFLGYGVAHLVFSFFDINFQNNFHSALLYSASIIFFGFIFYALYSFIVRRTISIINDIEGEIKKFSLTDFLLGITGLIVGLLISAMISLLLSKLNIPFISSVISIVIYCIISVIFVSLFLHRKEEFIRMFRSMRKSTSSDNVLSTTDKYLDTSVIIDGRIYDILKTKFIDGNIIIPSFILEELQYIADSEDSSRRQRGRRGLDILNDMRSEFSDRVILLDVKKEKEVPHDIALINLAEKNNASVLTNDFNLNKVAVVRGISVLNINDLANALKPVILPGEEFSLVISQIGKEHDQGVGYLNDGTMVVVEDGKKFIGEEKKVVVTSILQTSAGRMIFVKIVN